MFPLIKIFIVFVANKTHFLRTMCDRGQKWHIFPVIIYWSNKDRFSATVSDSADFAWKIFDLWGKNENIFSKFSKVINPAQKFENVIFAPFIQIKRAPSAIFFSNIFQMKMAENGFYKKDYLETSCDVRC